MSEKLGNLEGIVNSNSSFLADLLSTLRLQFISEIQAIKENPLDVKVYFNAMQASLVATEILQIPYLITTLEQIEEKYFRKDNLITYSNENAKLFLLKYLEYISQLGTYSFDTGDNGFYKPISNKGGKS